MIADVAAQLLSLAEQSHDEAGYFAALYAAVTSNVAASLGRGVFDDDERMERFAGDFASWYLRPRTGGGPVPRCWRAAFDVEGDPRLLIVQHLLLGVNAHVNHDLPQVVVALAERDGDLAAVRGDFDTVNDILAATQAEVLRRLDRVSRWVNVATSVGGGRAFSFSLRRAREQAWGAAERLWPLDRAGRAAYVAELDRLVAVVGLLVTRPAFPVSLAMPVLRAVEESDPRKVTRALLTPSPSA